MLCPTLLWCQLMKKISVHMAPSPRIPLPTPFHFHVLFMFSNNPLNPLVLPRCTCMWGRLQKHGPRTRGHITKENRLSRSGNYQLLRARSQGHSPAGPSHLHAGWWLPGSCAHSSNVFSNSYRRSNIWSTYSRNTVNRTLDQLEDS